MKRIILIVLTMMLILCVGNMVRGDTNNNVIYYESIYIEQGNTLWEIANEYKPQSMKTKDFVKEIMKFNRMKSSDIKYGHHILIPMI